MTQETALALIKGVIDDINAERPPEGRIAFSDKLVLLGQDSQLDSLDFVNFVELLQGRLAAELGRPVDLTAGILGGAATRPFQSVSALSGYLVSISGSTGKE